MAVAFIDLDDFKSINDRYGHTGGDKVLKGFSTRLKQYLRNSDLVGRIGGEEFSVILPNIDFDNAIQVLDNIRKSASENSINHSDKYIQYSISLGVSLFNQDNVASLEELIQQADSALYQAKRTGKNCLNVYCSDTQ